MAGLRFSLLIFLLSLGLSANDQIEESSFGSEIRKLGEPVFESKKTGEVLEGKNAISQLLSDSAFYPTETMGEHIIGQKVLEIVKNPVNVDLNKLPSDVIDKIAEGGVTTPKAEAKPEPAEKKKSETLAEDFSRTETTEETTTATAKRESTTTVLPE